MVKVTKTYLKLHKQNSVNKIYHYQNLIVAVKIH